MKGSSLSKENSLVFNNLEINEVKSDTNEKIDFTG